MVGKQEGRPLSFKAIETMKAGEKDKADIGENCGLRVLCGAKGVKSFLTVTPALQQVTSYRLKSVISRKPLLLLLASSSRN